MDRRDFLHPRRLAHAAGHVLGALDALQPNDETDAFSGAALLRLARRAMATTFEIVFPYDNAAALEYGGAAFDLLDELEARLTAYRETSEVCRLNRTAAHAPTPVEDGLFGLLRLAAWIHDETGGAFDVTAGALVKVWGFFRGPRRVPSEAELRAAMERVGMRWVELDPATRGVFFRRRGLEINLGAIGKGYALDRVAAFLGGTGKFPAALLHGGRSSVYAKGAPPDEPRGWLVAVAHPWEPGRRLAEVWLRDRGLGTSAATFRHLEYNGKKLGHVLDPRTGWPAGGVASATVLAPTAAEADALSTAFYVGGVDLARRYCAARPEVSAVLLPEGEGAAPVVLGLAPDEVTLPPAPSPLPLSPTWGEG
jgi:thiamine biosynthesis lipoprotein